MKTFGTAIALALLIGPAWAADRIPPTPSPAMMRLIGEYGPSPDLLEVYESSGMLYADGQGLRQQLLSPRARDRFDASVAGRREELSFAPAGKTAAWVSLGGQMLPRRDIGAEVIAQIRAGEHADPATLRAEALKASPPAEPPANSKMDLVAITSIDPSIKLDIRYATSNNFMGFPLYRQAGAYLQRPAAEALGRVAKALRAKGYGLLIHDAYRPWFVTKMFWDATPVASRMFVADPASGSRHNRGSAVDLTLYDLATGKPARMTGHYDEMSKRSYADYIGGTSRERWLRGLLRTAMEREGFKVLHEEWWHFDYKDWSDYPIGNVPFSELRG
jgi:D-alanyl-D-alanine dipeptidase